MGVSGSALNQSRALLFVAGLSYFWLSGYVFIKGEAGYLLPAVAATAMGLISFMVSGLTYISSYLRRNHSTTASLFFVLHSLFPVFFMWKMTDHNPAVLFIILFALVSIFQMSALRFIILHNVVLFLSLLFIHFTGQTSDLAIPAVWFFGSLIVSTAAAGVVQYFRIKNQRIELEERLISAGILHTTSDAWLLIAMDNGHIKYAGKRAIKLFEIDKSAAGVELLITDILGSFGSSIIIKALQDPSSKPIAVECRKSSGNTFNSHMKCIRVSSQPDIVFCSFTEGIISESTEGKTLQTAMRFRYYLNLTEEGIIVCDQEGRTTLINRPALEILGLDHSENHTGKMLRELTPSSLWMKINDYLITSLSFEKKFEIEDLAFGKLQVSLHRINDLFDGSPQVIIKLERSRIIDAAANQSISSTTITDHTEGSSVPLITLDAEGNILRMNENFCKLIGYSQNEIATIKFSRILHPSDHELYRKHLEKVTSGHKTRETELRFISREGKARNVRINTRVVSDENGLKEISHTAIDVTGYVLSNDALSQAISNVNAVVENTDDPIFSIDFNYRITVMNTACENEFKMRTGQKPVTGDDIRWFLNEKQAETWSRHFNSALSGQKVKTQETMDMEDGRIENYEMSFHPIQSTENKVEGISVHIRNITDRIQYEKQITDARDAAEKATKEKSEFLSTMSHEIRTPLNGLLGMTELLMTTQLSGKQKEFADSIRLSGEALLSVINDILDHSRIESGKMEFEEKPFELKSCILDTFNIVALKAKEQNDRLNFKIDDFIPSYFNGDKARIRQILVNLVGNAVKFTNHGNIDVNVSGNKIEDGEWELQFDVCDTGIGMTEEQTQKIFESFTQADPSTFAKYGGSGLGLSISARLAARMRGKVWVKSEPGKGSVFSFTIRLKQSFETTESQTSETTLTPSIAAPVTAPVRESKGIGIMEDLSKDYPLKIMIAEDNSVNQTLARIIFQRLGYEPDMADNGQVAVELAALKHYDIIFMDVQMPLMDGIEATSKITSSFKPDDPRPVIIAMTAYALDGDRDRCIKAGMTDYLSKPVMIDDIRRLLIRHGEAIIKSRKVIDAEPIIPKPELIEPNDSVLIDENSIERLRQLSDGENQFLKKLVMLFIEQSEQNVAQILELAASGDVTATGKAAHKLKGSSLNVGAAKLSRMCADIEKHCINNEMHLAEPVMKELEDCYRISVVALEKASGLK